MFKKLLILVICLNISFPVFAADKMDVRVQLIDGKEFDCFIPADAQVLLEEHIKFPKLNLKIEKLEELVDLGDKKVEKITQANSNLLDQNHFLIVENVRLQKKLESNSAWYRSPYFWFIAGLILGTGTTATVIYLVK